MFDLVILSNYWISFDFFHTEIYVSVDSPIHEIAKINCRKRYDTCGDYFYYPYLFFVNRVTKQQHP